MKEKPSGSVSSMYEDFVSNAEQSAQLENFKTKCDILHKKLAESKTQIADLRKVRVILIFTIFRKGILIDMPKKT